MENKIYLEIRDHLEAGGFVQVSTYTKSTVYSKKHAGMFFSRNGSLCVKRGRSVDQLSIGDRPLVKIQFGNHKEN